MNELGRSAYLVALGVDNYVSRYPLPGAAPSRRLQVVVTSPVLPAQASAATAPPVTAQIPAIEGSRQLPAQPAPASPRRESTEVPRFTLSAIVAGNYLWLEELAAGALAREQVQLVAAMALALQPPAVRTAVTAAPDVALFKWPLHGNRQLEQDADAARAGVAAFVARRLQQNDCRGLVLLGAGCRLWVSEDNPGIDLPVVVTASTLDMLREPSSKAAVWRDLAALRRG